ncbi:hypothetical protein RDABS01_003587, partial [Bienertia sinuspersici]
ISLFLLCPFSLLISAFSSSIILFFSLLISQALKMKLYSLVSSISLIILASPFFPLFNLVLLLKWKNLISSSACVLISK